MTTTATNDMTLAVAAGLSPIPFDFQAASATEVGVIRDNIPEFGTYTVTLNGDGTGFIQPLGDWGASSVTIFSDPNFEQNATFARFGPFYPDQIEAVLDRMMRTIVSLKNRIDRAGPDATLRTDLAGVNGVSLVNGAAKSDFSNITGANKLLTAENEFSPVGNPTITHGRMHLTGETTRSDFREFLFSFGGDMDDGAAGVGAAQEKCLVYMGGIIHPGAIKGWTLNPLLRIEPGTSVVYANAVEVDIDNYSGGDYGSLDGAAGLAAPSVYGMTINGANSGPNTVTAALALLTSSATIYERGFMVGPGSTRQAAFDDYSAALYCLRDQGAHQIGLNLGGTYSVAAIRIPNNKAILARNGAGTGDIAILSVDANGIVHIGDAVASNKTQIDTPLTLVEVTAGSVPNPAAGRQNLFIDSADHLLKYKNSAGVVTAV